MSRAVKDLVLPLNEDQRVFERVIARIRAMTPQEMLQSSVDAGIHKPNGQLTKDYLPRPAKRRRKRVVARTK
jgi:hypothetical protein